MHEITCLDANGNSVDYFTQWDTAQKYIGQIDITSNVVVHFCHKDDVNSISVEPTFSDGKIIADIPDRLFKTAKPIYVYIYSTDSSKTIAISKLFVRKKPKPVNYPIEDDEESKDSNVIKFNNGVISL